MLNKYLPSIRNSFDTSISQARRSKSVGKELLGEASLSIVFGISANLELDVRRFVSKKKLLLMQRSFDSSIRQVARKSSGYIRVVNGSAILNHIYSMSPLGSMTLSGSSSLTNTHTLLPLGSKYLRGYCLFAEGEFPDSIVFTLSGTGTRERLGAANLNNIYSLSSYASMIRGGIFSGDIIFDLSGELTSETATLKRVLFNLNIVQQKLFNLPIKQTKMSILKI